jgi:hypothetical protein
MIGQTFTLIGSPKLVFRLVWRGSIAWHRLRPRRRPQRKIPEPEARRRCRVRRGRLVDQQSLVAFSTPCPCPLVDRVKVGE